VLRIDVVTLFPRMIEEPLRESILGRAAAAGLLRVTARDLRPFGEGRHHVVDDAPYGGGAGMVMKPGPLVSAIEAARAELDAELAGAGRARVVLLDPQGVPFVQASAARLAREAALVLVCGRYEGVDERVREFVDETLSVGDFVLTGGEFAALCVVDAAARLVPGVLGNEASGASESFSDADGGLLEGPQYTRPVEFRGRRVPEALLSGDHARVARWRHEQALARTRAARPDLLAGVSSAAEPAGERGAARTVPEQTAGTTPEVRGAAADALREGAAPDRGASRVADAFGAARREPGRLGDGDEDEGA